jgi:hypothetical protein
LIIGQSKGYQHDSIASAMASSYHIGHTAPENGTPFKTDCTNHQEAVEVGNQNLNSMTPSHFLPMAISTWMTTEGRFDFVGKRRRQKQTHPLLPPSLSPAV